MIFKLKPQTLFFLIALTGIFPALLCAQSVPVFTQTPQNRQVSCEIDYLGDFDEWYKTAGNAEASSGEQQLAISALINISDARQSLITSANAICPDGVSESFGFFALDANGMSTDTVMARFRTVDNNFRIQAEAQDTAINCSADALSILTDWVRTIGGAIVDNGICSDTVIWNSYFWTDNQGNSRFGDPKEPQNLFIGRASCDWNARFTFEAIDACGNSDLTTANFRVTDLEAPVFDDGNLLVTVLCEDDAIDSPLQFVDNCDDNLDLQFVDSSDQSDDSSDCGFYNYVIARSWTATDACGAAAQITQTIEVRDTVAPEFRVPMDLTLSCIDELELIFSADELDLQDNCDSNPSFSFNDSFDDNSCETLVNRFWEISDACGNSTVLLQRISIKDTIAPSFTVPADISLSANDSTEPSFTGEPSNLLDNCSINFEINFIDENQGDILCGSVMNRTWSVSDGCNNTTEQTQRLVITNLDPPTFINPADITLDCGADNTIENTGEPSFILVSCDGDVTVTSRDSLHQQRACSDLTRFWSVSDAGGNTTTQPQLISIDDREAPSFDVPANIVLTCLADTSVLTTGLPTNLLDNCVDQPTLNYLDEYANNGCIDTLLRTWIATDDCDNSFSQVQRIILKDTIPPDFDLPANFTAGCQADIFFGIDTITNIIDNCSAVGKWTFEDEIFDLNPCIRQVSRLWTISDACGNSQTKAQEILLEDQNAPIFTVPADLTFECAVDDITEAALGSPTDISDDCDSSPVASFMDMTFDDICSGSFQRRWMVSDACGNIREQIQTITVIDTIAPEFDIAPSAAIACLDDLTDDLGTPSGIIDNCDSDPMVTFSDSLTTIDNCQRQILRTWSVTDACGNIAEKTLTISEIDIIAPQIDDSEFSDISIESETCDYDLLLVFPTVTDACHQGDIIKSVAINDSLSTFSTSDSLTFILPVGEYSLRYFAQDCSGNIDSIDQQISIGDNTQRTITCPADDTIFVDSIGCTANYSLPSFESFYLGCDLQQEIVFSYLATGNTVIENTQYLAVSSIELNLGMTEISYMVDYEGYQDTCSFVVTVSDTIAPVFSCSDINLSLSPTGAAFAELDTSLVISNIFDNCAVDTFSLSAVDLSCASAGSSQQLIVTGSDQSGNESTCTVLLTIEELSIQAFAATGICTGDSLRLFSDIELPVEHDFTFLWTGPNDFSSDEIEPIILNPTPENSGTYTLSFTANHDCVLTSTVDVSINAEQIPEITLDQNIYCVGDELVISATPFSGDVSYQWFEGSRIVAQTTEPRLLIDTLSGNYTYSVQVADIGCISPLSSMVNIELLDAPVVDFDSQQRSFCPGEAYQTNVTVFGDNVLYAWTGPNGFTSNTANISLTNLQANNAGIYELVVSNAACENPPIQLEISVLEASAMPIIQAQNSYCTNDNIQLTADISGADMYAWYQDGSLFRETSTPDLDLNTEGISATGQWSVQLVSGQCSSPRSTEINILVLDAPVVNFDNQQRSFCPGEAYQTDVTVFGDNVVYAWTGPNGFTSNTANISLTNLQTNNAGIYELIVSNAACENAPIQLEISILEASAMPIIQAQNSYCLGDNIQLTVDISGADVYAWYQDDVLFRETPSPSLDLTNADFSSAGDWTVQLINGSCNSPISDPFSITVSEDITVEITTNSPVCVDELLQFSTDFDESATFEWRGPDGFVSSEARPSLPAIEGSFTLSVMSASGCTDIQIFETVVNDPPRIVELRVDDLNCYIGTETLVINSVVVGTNDVSYSWSGPNGYTSTSENVEIANYSEAISGDYTLVVDANGCVSDPMTVNINFLAAPDPPTLAGMTEHCAGADFAVFASFGGDADSIVWDTPAGILVTDNRAIEVVTATTADAGIYTAAIYIDGCVSAFSEPYEIAVFDEPDQPQIEVIGALCDGASIQFSTDLVDGASYEWSGPNGWTSSLAEPVIDNITTFFNGSYQLRVSIGDCVSAFSDEVVLDIQSKPMAPVLIQQAEIPCLDNPNVVIEICMEPSSFTEGLSYILRKQQDTENIATSTTRCFAVDAAVLTDPDAVYVAYANDVGCPSDDSAPVSYEVVNIPTEPATIADIPMLCDDDVVQLSANQPPQTTGTWRPSNQDIMIDDINDPNTLASDFNLGRNLLVWSLSNDACGTFSSDTIAVFKAFEPILMDDVAAAEYQESLVIDPLGNDELPDFYNIKIIDASQNLEVSIIPASDNFQINLSPELLETAFFVYEICADGCPELCAQARVDILIGETDDCRPTNLITPNDDGINDRIIVPCFAGDDYPDNQLIIFNQWGDEVFNAAPYLNDWTGQYKNKVLPVGTYYYILDYGDGSEPISGFIVLEL